MEFLNKLFYICDCSKEIEVIKEYQHSHKYIQEEMMKDYQYYNHIHNIFLISCFWYSSYTILSFIYNKYTKNSNESSHEKERYDNQDGDSDNDGTVEIKERFDNLFKPVKIKQEDKISLLSSSFPEFDATIGSVNDL